MVWLIVCLVLLAVLLSSKGKAKGKRKNLTKDSESYSKNALERIRKGYQIYVPNMSVEGIQFHKDEANFFIDSSNQTLTLEVEPSNQVDKNAIKVIGECSKGKFHLGYVAKDIALKLAITNSLPYVYARLVRLYRSEQNYVDITYQIIGMKDKKALFDSYEKNLPITSSQKIYLKFWKIKYDDAITTSQANELLIEHYKEAELKEPEKWIEWQRIELINEIYENFSDKDEREQFDIKKPTKKQIEAAIDALLLNGHKVDALFDDYQLVVDKLTEVFPALER